MMPSRNYDPSRISSRVLSLLTKLNMTAGMLILILLIASLLAESWVMSALGVRPGDGFRFVGMRLIMVVGIVAVVIVHVVLTRLLAIVRTVNAGDPFVLANAARLKTIAWATLGLELLHIVGGAIATNISSAGEPLHYGWGISPARLVAVLLLFVLAGVFDQGARMREDLEGTV